MFEINKQAFGAFVASLRREKGMTQKELAARLCISDKAVSKWETGINIPDVAMLMPLAEALEVSVTELLNCRRTEQTLDAAQVEDIVKTAIRYSEAADPKRRKINKRRLILYFLCLLIAAVEVTIAHLLGYSVSDYSEAMEVVLILCPLFGLYFMVFAMEKLPAYYDENSITAFSDGIFRINIPGVRFNNRNWPHILRVGQIWSMGMLVAYPVLNYTMRLLFPSFWAQYETNITLVLLLGGLFIPLMIVGRKYQ
ncbi:MAG: helix-turn-helix transcriptional regulator [Oscillospiraceae bacterium]|nr:helix-turn-helix transcriptional regulator [Oscillospiraceae bacterium]